MTMISRADFLTIVDGGHDDDRDRPELTILLDLFEDLSAALLRQAQIEQNEVRPRRLCMLAHAPQEAHRFLAVFHMIDAIAHLAVLERLDRQAGVVRAIFNEQDFNWFAMSDVGHGWGPSSARICNHGVFLLRMNKCEVS